MAKFDSYYGLCPIIDQQSLLGINHDAEPGQVLVTLGKNIAIKYKLIDQKQVTSWRTKDKFSSPVIYYDKGQKYCAAFNKLYLRFWNDDEEYLDKHKKFKFNKPIHTLANCGNQSFVVFCNGAIVALEDALKERRAIDPENVIKEEETIVDVLMYQQQDGNQAIYAGLLIQHENSTEFVWSLQGVGEPTRIILKRDSLTLSGYVVTTCGQEIVLLTLWSDGKMYSHPLVPSTNSETSKPTFLTYLDSISCKDKVTMVPLNEDYLVMYTAESSQEGAVLLIYNLQFKVQQCRQPFKMYTSGTRLWCLQSNIFLCVGQNLAVVPYHLGVEQLAALVGSHKSKIIDPDIAIVQELVSTLWDDTKKLRKKKREPNARIIELNQQGWPETSIIEELLPKYMEDDNLEAIEQCLDYFQDIPEFYRIKLLNYLLTIDAKQFNHLNTLDDKFQTIPEFMNPMQRCHLVDKILIAPFSSIVLLPQLRMHLPMMLSLLLLRYVCYLLSEKGHFLGDKSKLDVSKNDRKLLDWGCVILDANYQKFLLTKDPQIVEVLSEFNEVVKGHLCCLDELQQLVPFVDNIQRGKRKKGKNVQYSIEKISLY